MKIALVHDYLNQYGGAERVLETLAKIFPDAPIYTLFYDKDKTLSRFDGRIRGTSFLDSKIVANNHRLFIPLMPAAASWMNLKEEYDLIFSSSAGFGKGISYHPKTLHIAYCHTPLRYAWESDRYFNWNSFWKLVSAPVFWYLRKWDLRAAQKPEILIANSRYIAGKIKDYYKRDAEVIYPPVDLKVFYRDKKVKKGGYFLAVGRMLPYKRFDLVIQAFNRLNLPLLVAGDGPELENLKKISKSSKIHFLPFTAEAELRTLYNGAEAVVFPQTEDFGLVAAETQACGTPVIAYSRGGAREIIKDEETGILFNNQTVDDLIMAVKKFQIKKFDSKTIRASALRFSENKFKKAILKAVCAARDGK